MHVVNHHDVGHANLLGNVVCGNTLLSVFVRCKVASFIASLMIFAWVWSNVDSDALTRMSNVTSKDFLSVSISAIMTRRDESSERTSCSD